MGGSLDNLRDLTLLVPGNGVNAAQSPLSYRVKAAQLNGQTITLRPFTDEFKLSDLSDATGPVRALLQDPVDSYVLYCRLLKGGALDAAISNLVAMNDPEAAAQAVAMHKNPEYLKQVRTLREGVRSLKPILLISRRPDLVELYVLETGIDGGRSYANSNVAKLKKSDVGWKLLPAVFSDKNSAETLGIKDAIGKLQETGGASLKINSQDYPILERP
jgi:hypothetical protein